MTVNEFTLVAAELRTIYSWANLLQNEEAMEIWYRHLKDIPDGVVTAVVSKWIESHSNPPTPADIRSEADVTLNGVPPVWSDGWEQVQKAISRWGYMNKSKALATMDDITKRAVNALGWEAICTSENPEAIRAQFRMAYESYSKRAFADRALQENTRNALSGFSDTNRLIRTLSGESSGLTRIGGGSD